MATSTRATVVLSHACRWRGSCTPVEKQTASNDFGVACPRAFLEKGIRGPGARDHNVMIPSFPPLARRSPAGENTANQGVGGIGPARSAAEAPGMQPSQLQHRRVMTTAEQVVALWLEGQARHGGLVSPADAARDRPFTGSQTRKVLASWPALTRVRPPGENARAQTMPAWPVSESRSVSLSGSQSFTVPSSPALARASAL